MFLDKDFILQSDMAKALYHNHAEHMPIIDYHCHLDPKAIWENKPYENLTQVWLFDNGAGDHYKWRLMRANGEDEKNITGDGEAYDRFFAFARTMEKAIGNPIFEWSHLELRRYFDIDLMLNTKNAPEIWKLANEKIAGEGFTPRSLLKKMNVQLVCTTDDPADDLQYHKLLAENKAETGLRVLPTLRPDKLMNIADASFVDYLKRLSDVSGIEISSYEDLEKAVAQRVDYFHSVGGRLADHGLNSMSFTPTTREEAAAIFSKRTNGETLSDAEVIVYQSAMNLLLMKLYKEKNWVLQMHMNVIRNASDVNFAIQGPDHGFDSAGAQGDLVYQVKSLLNEAQKQDALPKMILYSLNPNDNVPLATLMQSFQGGSKQQIQLGCAWWVNDNYSGMRDQLTTMMQQSLLGNFTGMLTDSRSFLSYPRHEYFRRILCQVIAELADAGRAPADEELLGQLVEDVCFNNANTWFGF